MFSNFELAVIEVDVRHVLQSVSLDNAQRKTRETIVEKIASHNSSMDAILLQARDVYLRSIHKFTSDTWNDIVDVIKQHQ